MVRSTEFSEEDRRSLWVLVPAFNESSYIEPTLWALADQDDTNFVLCVIDNGSDDGTPDRVAAFAARTSLSMVLLREPEKGVGCAIDTGARYAIAHGAQFLVRTDADTVPDVGWVGAARAGFDAGGELLVGPMVARRDENGVLARTGFRMAVLAASAFGAVRPRNLRRGVQRYRMHAGFNMGITAALYERCGGMPRRPSPTDRTFMNRVRAAGGRIHHVRGMQVGTSTRRFRALGVVGTARWYLDRGAAVEDPR